MAPEMHAGLDYSYAADVWSLGCLVYELCQLEPLFGDREEEVVARKVQMQGRQWLQDTSAGGGGGVPPQLPMAGVWRRQPGRRPPTHIAP